MAMNLLSLDFLCFTALVVTSLHLLLPASCVEWSAAASAAAAAAAARPTGLLWEEKSRVGSTPPSCHNRCNACNPCFPVQAPTIPTHDHVEPADGNVGPADLLPALIGKYPSYKPLGWKCRCGESFFNP